MAESLANQVDDLVKQGAKVDAAIGLATEGFRLFSKIQEVGGEEVGLSPRRRDRLAYQRPRMLAMVFRE